MPHRRSGTPGPSLHACAFCSEPPPLVRHSRVRRSLTFACASRVRSAGSRTPGTAFATGAPSTLNPEPSKISQNVHALFFQNGLPSGLVIWEAIPFRISDCGFGIGRSDCGFGIGRSDCGFGIGGSDCGFGIGGAGKPRRYRGECEVGNADWGVGSGRTKQRTPNTEHPTPDARHPAPRTNHEHTFETYEVNNAQ